MRRVFRAVLGSILATVVLSWNSFALSGPGAGKAAPARNRPQERDVLRLEEMIIQGNADKPAVLFLLPRAESPVFPLTPGPGERKESILRDTRDEDHDSLSVEPWADRSDHE